MALRLADGLTLYFARHGETEANVEKRFQGHTSDTPLTEKGLWQAQEIASIIAKCVTDPATLSYVSSPLHRAERTMEIVRATLGLPADGFATDPRLIEIDLGAWDGLTHAEAKARFPEAYKTREADKWNVDVPGGGENYKSVAERLESFIGDLSADTFAISHGAATRILRGLFAGMTWQQMSALDEPQGVVFSVRGSVVVRHDPA
ncbi:MAG TPA: histidine phosphatase family protein [Rhizomicrobium sp.]|nr:histidine phosphatase family protein [Rhizomicrobium sp.]